MSASISMGLTVTACKVVWPQMGRAREEAARIIETDYSTVVRDTTAFFGQLEQAASDPFFRQPDVLLRIDGKAAATPGRERTCATVLRLAAKRGLKTHTDGATVEQLKTAIFMLDNVLDTPPVERLAELA